MHSMKRQGKIAKLAVYAGLLFSSAFAAFPIIWMGAMSIRPDGEVFAWPPSLFPETFTMGAYETVVSTPAYVRFFVNSYIVAGIVTFGTLLIAIIAAYGFSRLRFFGKKTMNLFVISTQTVPPISLLIPYFSMVIAFKLFDTYLALYLTYAAMTLPYAILMMTGYFNTISSELDDAVMIDGGSRWYVVWRVLVPLSIPGIVATGVYTFMLSWNEFLFALTLTQTEAMRTVPVGISLFMGQHAYQWSVIMSMSVLGSLPVLLLYLVAQRFFLSGLTAGSVK